MAVVRNNEGQLGIVALNTITSETLEELRESMKVNVDKFIDNLLKQNEGHVTNKGIIIHPLIHVIYDDLLTPQNLQELNNIYAKDLN